MQETTSLVFSPDDHTLASICRTESLKLWHLPTRREVYSRSIPKAGTALEFSPDGRLLAVATEENSIRLMVAPTLDLLDRP